MLRRGNETSIGVMQILTVAFQLPYSPDLNSRVSFFSLFLSSKNQKASHESRYFDAIRGNIQNRPIVNFNRNVKRFSRITYFS